MGRYTNSSLLLKWYLGGVNADVDCIGYANLVCLMSCAVHSVYI
jgi:hypothetical protein